MDEYIAPNCTAVMEPGREFSLLLDNAPSYASRLACEHYKTLLHGTVEFQPPCPPDLSPSDFFLWKELKTQLVQHPAPANPAELRALLTRVYHRTWGGSREMFEKMGNAWVRRLKASVAAKGGFFEQHRHGTDMAKTQRKNKSSTRHLTPCHSPQTPTAPQRQTTRGKTLLFCDTSRTKNFRPLEPKTGPGGPKNLEHRPWGHFFVFSVPQMVENTLRK